MKNKLKSLLISVLCLAFVCSAVVGCSTTDLKAVELPHYAYTADAVTAEYNSNLFYRNDIQQKLGDPTTILITEGEYEGWLYSTGTTSARGYVAYRTKDFVNWETVGPIFTAADNHFGQESFWAPQYYWDENARYEDYNIPVGEGEDGTGLYFLFYSAKTGAGFDVSVDGIYSANFYPAVAISKTPDGPFKEYEGYNKLGEYMDASTPLFNIEHINPETGINLDEGADPGQELYKEHRSFIDACPYVDPVTGDKYLYMARNRMADVTNEIWGVKMLDWVTPDYNTVHRLTSFGYIKTKGSTGNEKLNFTGYIGDIDEGPFMYYKDFTDDGVDNGKYYLTFSIGGTSNKLYPVAQAIGDTPLGPFTKIQPEKGGLVCCPGIEWDINASGHHCFVEIGDELYVVYHTYEINFATGEVSARGQAFDKVYWMENEDGQMVMHANGPTKVVQPIPEFFSGYKNVATAAAVTADGEGAEYLNDGLVKMHDYDNVSEYTAGKKSTTITLSWEKPVIARALMVYNSFDFERIFTEIKSVKLYYLNESNETGCAYIDDLPFDFGGNIVPLDYILTPEEMETENLEEYYSMRAGGASVAEFNELKITSLELTIERAKGKNALSISDVVVLGKDA